MNAGSRQIWMKRLGSVVPISACHAHGGKKKSARSEATEKQRKRAVCGKSCGEERRSGGRQDTLKGFEGSIGKEGEERG